MHASLVSLAMLWDAVTCSTPPNHLSHHPGQRLWRLQEHFASTGPSKSAAQRKRQQEELLQNVPEEARGQIDTKLLDIATSMNLVGLDEQAGDGRTVDPVLPAD